MRAFNLSSYFNIFNLTHIQSKIICRYNCNWNLLFCNFLFNKKILLLLSLHVHIFVNHTVKFNSNKNLNEYVGSSKKYGLQNL